MPPGPQKLRCEDGADGPGVRSIVGMPAHPFEDGADVQAGTTPDAVKRLPSDGIGKDPGPSVIQQDEMEIHPMHGWCMDCKT